MKGGGLKIAIGPQHVDNLYFNTFAKYGRLTAKAVVCIDVVGFFGGGFFTGDRCQIVLSFQDHTSQVPQLLSIHPVEIGDSERPEANTKESPSRASA